MLGWCVETILVAGGLALVATLASRLRSIGPTLRHLLWLVVMIKLATPPLVSWPWATSWLFLNRPITSPAEAPTTKCEADVDDDLARLEQRPTEPTSALASFKEMNLARAARSDAPTSAHEIELETKEIAAAPQQRTWRALPSMSWPDVWLRWVLPAWLAGSVVLALGQGIRVIRFRRHLSAAVPGPDRLVAEVEWIGERLGTSVPEILVVPNLGTPLLWCLGRPRLLLPTRLVKTLPLDRWRGILIHELAHLRRGDHWVSRLELAAGLIWWWNPLYWLARTRLDTEAELACDAWVVWAIPKDRLAYAEVLLDVCASLSMSMPPSPALGVAGSGRFFERRLTLILHDHVSCRLSPLGLLGACLLLLFAVPSWSKPLPTPAREDVLATLSAATTTSENAVADGEADDDSDDDKKIVRKDRDDDDEADDDSDGDDDDDDDADDDDNAASRLKEKAKAKAKKSDRELDVDNAAIKKEIEVKFGPDSDFEKKVEELGEKIEKEMEAKFGPGSEFEKKMEAFGKEMEAKFGEDSEFAKKMEAFGKEMEAKFGEGSEFAKKMEAFGKEMEAKFGAGSDFEKKMKDLGDDMKKKYGPGSEFAKNVKDKVDVDIKGKKRTGEKQSSAKAQAELDRAEAANRKTLTRERRIKKLEAQIRELVDEIKALKADDSEK
jgi:beta-lactamase regulating signal transducer with metallopeptidase domain